MYMTIDHFMFLSLRDAFIGFWYYTEFSVNGILNNAESGEKCDDSSEYLHGEPEK